MECERERRRCVGVIARWDVQQAVTATFEAQRMDPGGGRSRGIGHPRGETTGARASVRVGAAEARARRERYRAKRRPLERVSARDRDLCGGRTMTVGH